MEKLKNNLLGLNLNELKEILAPIENTPYRIKQIWKWIYLKGASNFDEMTDLSKDFRNKLKQNFSINRPLIVNSQYSKDGTIKWLLQLTDGNEIECVYIKSKKRNTLCVSSQIGCNMACKFCKTGTQRMVRNLTAAEIIAQVIVAKDEKNDWNILNKNISNIVFMGMGEPLQNYNEVTKAIEILTDETGLNFSNRKITLSTCGIVPNIYKMDNDLKVNLAISLHAANHNLRSTIMPINEKYPLDELINACKNYQNASNVRRITIEYIMLDGINDSLDDAKELVKILKGIPVKVNLLPFNPWPNSPFKPSSREKINAFADYLHFKGISAPIRESKGDDISAACGQLKSESIKKPNFLKLQTQ